MRFLLLQVVEVRLSLRLIILERGLKHKDDPTDGVYV